MTMILAMFLGVFGIDEVVSGLAGATTIDGALLRIDAFLHSLGKDSGFVKDARGQDLRLGLSMCRLKDGRMQRDWFSG
ncbi:MULTISPECIES: hypothetical protein [Marinobacter]|uniref:Uncharacterized protein n=1 Tax=Marinobacter excellens LAMA 842 TaxID=1306954 RepID=A0A137S3M7_9GAMM|nr:MULTISPECIES: hypothetical protein [Marinobacter]KXO07031.1 hypothetical protein J122_3525 [Marinobacter excellens LAMA 842]MCD1629630.1 TM2 domain-containing protein [Marinobacter shengliensis]